MLCQLGSSRWNGLAGMANELRCSPDRRCIFGFVGGFVASLFGATAAAIGRGLGFSTGDDGLPGRGRFGDVHIHLGIDVRIRIPDDKRIPADGRFWRNCIAHNAGWVNWQPMVVADTDRYLGIQALAIVGRVDQTQELAAAGKPLIDWIYGPFVLFLGELSSRNIVAWGGHIAVIWNTWLTFTTEHLL